MNKYITWLEKEEKPLSLEWKLHQKREKELTLFPNGFLKVLLLSRTFLFESTFKCFSL